MIVTFASRALERIRFSSAARPLRFVGTGGIAGCTQLVLLAWMTQRGVPALAANLLAFLLAAQLNFALSWYVTWGDRRSDASAMRCWAIFHGSIALMALLNFAVFAIAHIYLPLLAASALGILAGASGNYVSGDLIVFRRGHENRALRAPHKHAA